MLRCDVFTDLRYHAEQFIDLDPDQVIATEEKTVRLFLGGRHRVTVVTLRNGEQHTLSGFVAQQIKNARTAVP
jgi:archaellum component FlaG (FlaF/FlaG flagellin family)